MSQRCGSSLLLKPTRDLEQNWDIDVASELEAYLNQVEEQVTRAKEGLDGCGVGDTEDDEPYQINFVEAALMLQCGTSVYSKKVEYLLALTYKTLQNFSSFTRKGISCSDTLPRRTGKAWGRRPGKSSDDWDNMDILFIPWNAITPTKADDYISNVKLDNGIVQCPYIHNLLQKSVPTNAACEKAPLRLMDIKLQHHSKMHIMPLLLVPRDDRNELRVTSLPTHPKTGSLLVDSQDVIWSEQFSLTTEDAQICDHNISLSETPRPSTSCYTQGLDSSNTLLPLSERTPLPASSRQINDTNTMTVSGSHAFHSTTRTNYDMDATLVSKETNPVFKIKSRLAQNPLQRLNCHQQLGRNRPQKVGNTSRKLNQEIYLSPTDTLQSDSLLMFTLLQRSTLASFSSMEKSITFAERQTPSATKLIPTFPDLKSPNFLLADAYRLGSTWCFLENTFISTFRSTCMSHPASSDIEMQLNREGNLQRCNENDWEAVPATLKETESTTYDSLTDIQQEPDATELNPDVSLETSLGIDTDIEAAVMGGHATYSDMLQKSFGNGSLRVSLGDSMMDNDSKTGLRQRVAIWRTNVDRWLQKVNTFPSFDVGVYKINLANSIHDTQQSSTETVSFQEVVSGRTRSEVCRYFLTALLLCDEKKIVISPKSGQESNFDILPVVSDEITNEYAYCAQSDSICGLFYRKKIAANSKVTERITKFHGKYSKKRHKKSAGIS
ncbi:uncharacterized protein LOC128884173 isoform X2 [Hylaeus volcanicus]|uniref:uncharacterized protein LOC128884173 isoform X2 n=1 Tax=Hylaeus volcanicus TaxID=313075 RepID=UPI0023B7E7C9|nr:uncharacterized protein LOC128884173 isoform X2 [Hylaeus volcanicus]